MRDWGMILPGNGCPVMGIVDRDLGAGGIYKSLKSPFFMAWCRHSSNGLLRLVLVELVEAKKEECAILSVDKAWV